MLLTGDIEKKAEKILVNSSTDVLDVDVMLIPHHGSKTSSTEAFIKAISPKIVISSAGYKNPYKHPATIIVERYIDNGVKVLETSCTGQLSSTLGEQLIISEYRKYQRLFSSTMR